MRISGKTKLLGVIGNPVEHSLSPAIHNYAYELMGIDAVYLPVKAKEAYLEKVLDGVCFVENAVGFNVTVPFKERAAKAMDMVSDDAKAIGAVNTIKRGEDKLIGYNTDWQGFLESLRVNGIDGVNEALVLGAGGAAKAVAYALLVSGVKRLFVANRSRARLSLFLERFADERVIPVEWDETAISEVLPQVDLVVNTTTLGMDGEELPPVDFEKAFPGCCVYDVVYTPSVTPFLDRASRFGLKTVNGLDMLILQALFSMEIWFGIKPDFYRVKSYIENLLEGEGG
ncbi:MAG: shikimate dehydrogenase [Deferribacteres bacterium]|nr:shikimate dehydrogenase [Deferribacteres bacterium]